MKWNQTKNFSLGNEDTTYKYEVMSANQSKILRKRTFITEKTCESQSL